MLKLITMPGFGKLDQQIVKLRELRDSFRASNARRYYLPPEPQVYCQAAMES